VSGFTVLEGGDVVIPLADKVLGRTSAKDVMHPTTEKPLMKAGALATPDELIERYAQNTTRDLADIDDAMALANLKTLKASDAVVDQMMTAANVIEDEGTHMAPGSAAFLAGAGMIASVKSQAMMQRMFAAAIRQEAARVAHDNTVRKRNAMFGSQFRTDVQTMFKK